MALTDQLQEVKIMLHGTAASEGIGIGKVMLIEEHSLEYTPRTVTDTEAESQRFKAAVDAFCYNTEKQAENLRSSAGEKEAEILAGHIQIIKDPYLSGEIEKLIADGQCAESALEHMCDMFIAMFSAADDELTKQRAADVRDIKSGVLGILLGVNEIKVSDAPKGTVLVARELTPSVTAGIVKENIAGIITETGGTTSHSAILARALEIPAVLSVEGVASSLKNGDTVVVDGSEGAIIVNPDDNTVAEYSKKRDAFLAERKELENYRGRETKSASGEVYELFCNIGKPEDAVKAVDADGEGVGLFRTEFLFMDRTSIPTEDEQFEAYKKVLADMGGKEVIIRTLDIGADKQIGYFNLPKEDNPAMGMRALRICLNRPEIFKTQLRALYRASAFGKLGIMFPMVTSVWEVREAKKYCEEVKRDLKAEGIPFAEDVQVGIMIETPAAAIMSDRLAKEVDFFSCGTNDLTQYTLACDRQNNDLGRFYDPHNPAVLRLLKMVTENAHKNGIWVGICGELGADLTLTETFLAIGVDELSVSPRAVLPLRNAVRMTDTRESAPRLLAAIDAEYPETL